MSSSFQVIADLPRCGMCNNLFTWGQAFLYARENEAPLTTYGWSHFYPGPWLRGERIKRDYAKFFDGGGSITHWLKYRFAKKWQPSSILNYPTEHPSAANNASSANQARYHVFPEPWSNWPHIGNDTDFFRPLRGHEAVVKEGLLKMIRPEMRRLIEKTPAPEIALHIRRGDTLTLQKTGWFVTPDDYFCNVLTRIRAVVGPDTPATIFSDAHAHELTSILNMKNTGLAPPQPDIVDLFHLSKSQIIATSHNSTFGYWGGFLSTAAMIMHPNHETGLTRDPQLGLFEGTIEAFETQTNSALIPTNKSANARSSTTAKGKT